MLGHGIGMDTDDEDMFQRLAEDLAGEGFGCCGLVPGHGRSEGKWMRAPTMGTRTARRVWRARRFLDVRIEGSVQRCPEPIARYTDAPC